MRLEINADKATLRGPRVDGSYVLSFEVGEYEAPKLSQILLLTSGEMINLTVEQNTENAD